MASKYAQPPTPRVISPTPTPSETSERNDSYFAPITRSITKGSRHKSPDSIAEEKNDSGSDSSLEKRARSRTRSRSPIPTTDIRLVNGSKKRRMSGLTPVTKSTPLTNGHPAQPNGFLAPDTYTSRLQRSWREFSRSPSPLGLIPLHRRYRAFIHKHEVPRKLLHVSIGFLTLKFYTSGLQTTQITPWLLTMLVPIAATDLLRHRWAAFNRFYVRCLGALMRETEVDGYNGVIWYLLGAYIALQFFPKDIGVVSILLLSWCDTAASTFGRLYGRYTIRLRRGKSLAGTLAACLTGVLVALGFWGWLAPRVGRFPGDAPNAYMYTGKLSLPIEMTRSLGWKDGIADLTGNAALTVMGICTGLIASVSEFIDIFGWDDNLTIPVLSSVGLFGFLKVFGGN